MLVEPHSHIIADKQCFTKTFISANDLQIISLQLLVAHLLLFVQSSIIIHQLHRGGGLLKKKDINQYQ